MAATLTFNDHREAMQLEHENLTAALSVMTERGATESCEEIQDMLDALEGEWDEEFGHADLISDYPWQAGPTERDL